MSAGTARDGGGGAVAARGPLAGWVRWAYLPLLIAFTAAVFIIFLLDSDINKFSGTRVSASLSGTTPRPFAYRVLLPALTRSTAAVLPSSARDLLARNITPTPPDRMMAAVVRIEPGFQVETVIWYGWIGLFLLAFALTVEPFFRAGTGIATPWTRLVPFAALLGLPPFFDFAHYYDLPMLALSTLCLLFMVQRRWAAYLAVLAVACLNKETAVLFPLVFGLHFFRGGRMDRGRFRRLMLAQAAVVVLIRAGLMLAFASRPGGAVEFHLWEMLALNYRAYSLETGLAWGAVALAVLFDWNSKPAFLKSGLAMLAVLYGAHLVFGCPREIRVFYEVYPVVFSLALYPFLKRMP